MVARQTHSETLVGSPSTKNELVMTADVPTQLRELAEVGALSFQRGKDDPVRTEFPKLAARLLAKREAHDGAIKSFATTLSGISDQVDFGVGRRAEARADRQGTRAAASDDPAV